MAQSVSEVTTGEAAASPSWRDKAARRALQAASLGALFVLGYFGIGLSVDPERARALATPLDGAIPFVRNSIFLYAWTYTALFFPLFSIRCPRLFDRVALSYAIVLAVALPCFAAFPVTAVGLRAPVSILDPSRFADWGVLLNYALDPPTNLFPSLHLAIVTVAAGALWKARRGYGLIACGFAAAIAIAVCTVKQHFVLDAVAGLALGLGAYALAIRPYRRDPNDPPPAYGWRGPVLYLAFHGSLYAIAYLAFRAGVPPGPA